MNRLIVGLTLVLIVCSAYGKESPRGSPSKANPTAMQPAASAATAPSGASQPQGTPLPPGSYQCIVATDKEQIGVFQASDKKTAQEAAIAAFAKGARVLNFSACYDGAEMQQARERAGRPVGKGDARGRILQLEGFQRAGATPVQPQAAPTPAAMPAQGLGIYDCYGSTKDTMMEGYRIQAPSEEMARQTMFQHLGARSLGMATIRCAKE